MADSTVTIPVGQAPAPSDGNLQSSCKASFDSSSIPKYLGPRRSNHGWYSQESDNSFICRLRPQRDSILGPMFPGGKCPTSGSCWSWCLPPAGAAWAGLFIVKIQLEITNRSTPSCFASSADARSLSAPRPPPNTPSRQITGIHLRAGDNQNLAPSPSRDFTSISIISVGFQKRQQLGGSHGMRPRRLSSPTHWRASASACE